MTATAPATGPVDLDRLAALLDELTGLMLHGSGEGAEAIAEIADDVARAYGGRADLLLTAESAAVSITGGGETRTFVVRRFPDVGRLDRAVAVKQLAVDITRQRVDLPTAEKRLRAITESPDPYPWWLRLVGIVLFSVGFAPAVQRTWYEVGSTAVLATITAVLAVAAATRPRLNLVFPLLASTAVATTALAVFAQDSSHGGKVLIMLPALFFLVPGDILSAAATELAAGSLTTGAVRLVYATFLLVQLYIGVVIGAALTGTSLRTFTDRQAPDDLPYWAVLLGWAVFALGALLAFGVPWRLFGWMLVLVYLPLAVQAGATKVAGSVAGTFVAATVLSAAASFLARPDHRPPRIVLVLAGFFTLTVGSLGLRGLTVLAGGHKIQGFQDLGELVTQVVVIALGLIAGAALVPRPAWRAAPGPQPAAPDA
ncbi:threonine/serine ThrE exporter family protein [Yinghuangia soli]|uniref:Threonine/serine exporter family protein n=1 Tax=Yinghuangia soli TaxID=2908204 RepID=A0AA41PWT6_9ACTN|nr:threonine/serine exporter family protein [Yinghuangia soli]MCF2527284.1 threonine/serine exporter family protein [Yinghuangia soli]